MASNRGRRKKIQCNFADSHVSHNRPQRHPESQENGIFSDGKEITVQSHSKKNKMAALLAGQESGLGEGSKSCMDAHTCFAVKKGSKMGQEADGGVWVREQLHIMT